jgi:small GTP-binding protein
MTTVITSKVCIVGDFAVGKTSVAERFVTNQFSDKYLTTVGVKIDTKEIDLPGTDVRQKLVLWDVAGADKFGEKEFAYLRGAAGLVFVADGTRFNTVRSALGLREQIFERYGAVPSILLLNKRDLATEWTVSDERLEELGQDFSDIYLTSAKTGEEVENALRRLASSIVETTLSDAS